MTTVALADDHHLVRNALVELINNLGGFQVVMDAPNGKVFMEQLSQQASQPQIALLDINMPVMDGFETAQQLTAQYPNIKIMALSVDDNEATILKMIRCGAIGYLLKDTDTSLFKLALSEVASRGYYHNELVTSTLLRSVNVQAKPSAKPNIDFHSRELEFLELSCTELTYKEIADRMNLSPRTIDGYRESLFEKLEVKSRVGMVLFAIKNQFFAF
jgi:two-component system, NarL family, invasion response regulator UvrY